MKDMKLYAQIKKIDKEKRMVWGYASTEAVDSDGEIITKDAIKGAWEDYMQFANIREMHQSMAAGVVKEYEFDDTGVMIGAKIVDDQAWEKVKEEVYKGFSVGGKVSPGGYDPITKTISAMQLIEISLVDRPANPEALITMYKADNLEKSDMTTTAVANAAETKPLPTAEELKALLADPDTLALVSKMLKEHEDGQQPSGDPNPVAGATEQPADSAVGAAGGGAGDVADPGVAQVDPTSGAGSSAPGATGEAVGDAAGVTKAADVTDIKKSLYTVKSFASVLQDLAYVIYDLKYEAEYEGDSSPVPAALQEWLKGGVELFKAMAAEEADELAAALSKAATVNKAAAALELTKAGAKFSKATKEMLAKIHGACKDATEHLDKLGYADAAEEEDETAKIAKALVTADGDLAKLTSLVEGLSSQLASANKKIDTLEKAASASGETITQAIQKAINELPAQPKGVLRVVEKGADLGTESAVNEVAPVIGQDGKIDEVATAIKKVHASGGQPLFQR